MAKPSQFVPRVEYARHLKPYGKRRFWHRHRRGERRDTVKRLRERDG